MSINLDNVKAIVHNNKNVVKIEDSHGIVWQKPSAEEWHTLWSGSRRVDGDSGTGWTFANVASITGSHPVRLSFSSMGYSASPYYGSYYGGYFVDGTATSGKPTSPVEFTLDFDGSSKVLLGSYCYHTTAGGSALARIQFYKSGSTKNVRLFCSSTAGSGSCSAWFVLTQIEVFY